VQTAPSPQGAITCPTCGERAEGAWRYCPVCREDLRRPGHRTYGPGADVDVRRDQRGTSLMLILQAVLGGFGLVYAGLIACSGLKEGTTWPLGVVVAVVLGIASFSAVRVYNRPQPPTGAGGVAQVFVQTLAGIGCLYTVLILIGFASIVVLFAVCLSQGFKV
jgi:hypothetical protein